MNDMGIAILVEGHGPRQWPPGNARDYVFDGPGLMPGSWRWKRMGDVPGAAYGCNASDHRRLAWAVIWRACTFWRKL